MIMSIMSRLITIEEEQEEHQERFYCTCDNNRNKRIQTSFSRATPIVIAALLSLAVSTQFITTVLSFQHVMPFVSRAATRHHRPLLFSSHTTSNKQQPRHIQQTSIIAALRSTLLLLSSSSSSSSFTSAESKHDDNNTNDTDDDDDWNAVVAGFQMYKAAYGDLKVPLKFVVPAMPPWPREAWNLKLGVRVASIRSTGRYVENHVERRKMLDDMGFVWRLRAIRKSLGLSAISDNDTSNTAQSAIPTTTTNIGISTTTTNTPFLVSSSSNHHNNNYHSVLMDGITFDQVYSALLTYKDLYCSASTNGATAASSTATTDGFNLNTIPNSFTVPNVDPWPEITRGMPLGKKLPLIKSKAYWASIPGAYDKLMDLGLDIDESIQGASPSSSSSANDARYQKVYVALATYKRMYGDLLVAQPFVVPTDDEAWPNDVWGLRLGARVNAIRSQGTFVNSQPKRKQELDELGFVWENPLEPDQKKRGRKKKEQVALFDNETFQQTNTNTNTNDESATTTTNTITNDSATTTSQSEDTAATPNDDSDSWAASIDSWRQQQQKRDLITPFEYDSPTSSSSSSGDRTTSMNSPTLPNINNEGGGTSTIPSNLIRREPEPETMEERSITAALRAGIISDVSSTGAQLSSSSSSSYGRIQPRQLSQSWYFDDYGDGFTFQHVVEALTIWGEQFKNKFDNIPDDFIIQSREEIEYEERNMGLRIPTSNHAISNNNEEDLDDNDDDDEDDIILEENEDSSPKDYIISSSNDMNRNNAVATTQAKTLMLPTAAKTISWSPNLVGMELGAIVRRIREGDVEVKTVPSKKAMLDDIHFDWGNEELFLDIPFEKAMCALFAYFQIRGDLFVYEEFVMPVDEPWPRILQGLELGKIVFNLRVKQRFLETHYPEKKAMLDFLEFVWFPKYQSKLTDFEIEHYKWFNYTQPERDTLDYLFPNAEDFWEEDNPPIFNFTKAKDYLDSLLDLSFLDTLDLEDDEDQDVEEEEVTIEDEDVEEEEYYDDDDEEDDDDDEDLDDDLLDAYETAIDGEQEESEAAARDVVSSKIDEDDDDSFDSDDADDDEDVINEGDDLEIEGVEGIDVGEEDDEEDVDVDVDEEFDLDVGNDISSLSLN